MIAVTEPCLAFTAGFVSLSDASESTSALGCDGLLLFLAGLTSTSESDASLDDESADVSAHYWDIY